jgi:hypothetical protein
VLVGVTSAPFKGRVRRGPHPARDWTPVAAGSGG